MKEQIHIFFTALMFYTRIPCPPWVDHRSDYLNRATVYFPLIGWIVGGASFLVFWLAAFLLNPLLALILSLASSVLITGAFHEDGFADTCDGFGGGWTQAQILKIMKDSRVGTYAAVGLILLFALKIAALYELSQKFSILDLGVIFILAHSSSRWMATTLIYTLDYARDPSDSKAKPV
ncbi:MAG: adenosylcobinamide-GDP ribazoletransferase, partial [Bacteroidota bacterium]